MGLMGPPTGGRNQLVMTAVAAVVAMLSIVGVVVVTLASTGNLSADSTPLIVSLIGIVTAALPALFALMRVEQTRNDLHNGVIGEKVAEAFDVRAAKIADQDAPAAAPGEER